MSLALLVPESTGQQKAETIQRNCQGEFRRKSYYGCQRRGGCKDKVNATIWVPGQNLERISVNDAVEQ